MKLEDLDEAMKQKKNLLCFEHAAGCMGPATKVNIRFDNREEINGGSVGFSLTREEAKILEEIFRERMFVAVDALRKLGVDLSKQED